MKEFDEYLRAKEPDMRERAYAWKTAIGLQKVDGLTPSAYLIKTARRNIEGEITLAESRKLVEGYYKARPVKSEEPDRVKEAVAHIVRFVSDVWQVHAFGEGNTRTTSIFTIKYLRQLGYDVTNDVFAENAWYFRNALVRANYTNLPRGVHPTTVYLERFFANLLLGGRYELKSRFLHVSDTVPPSELVPSKREQVGEQVKSEAIELIKARPSKFVARLLKKMKGEMTVLEMMAAVKLGGRRNFLERYLSPAVDAGFVEMTNPDSPRSPTQRYRLTEKGVEERGGKK